MACKTEMKRSLEADLNLIIKEVIFRSWVICSFWLVYWRHCSWYSDVAQDHDHWPFWPAGLWVGYQSIAQWGRATGYSHHHFSSLWIAEWKESMAWWTLFKWCSSAHHPGLMEDIETVALAWNLYWTNGEQMAVQKCIRHISLCMTQSLCGLQIHAMCSPLPS